MSRFRPVIAAGVLLLFFSSPGLTAEKISQDERYSKALYFYREELLSQAEEEIENLLSENPGHFEAQNLYREIKKIKARKLFLSALIYYEEKEFSSAREARKKGLSLMPEVLDDIAAENILKIKDLLVSQKALEARRETEKLSFLAPQDERVRDLKKLIESSFFRQLL
ncbi:MAG TPA: hypothetical protein VJC03_00575, partial [bacterium]|nr:hypothetical protein [bacterium]